MREARTKVDRIYDTQQRMPWNKKYQAWQNSEFIKRERYKHGEMSSRYDREIYRAQQWYKRYLLRPNLSKKQKYRAWRKYWRRVDRINKNHKIYSEKLYKKSTTKKIRAMIMDID